MCGIAGFIGQFAPIDEQKRVLLEMTNRLAHRGPDGSDIWCDPSTGLGHRRLAIHHTVPERALPWPRTAPSREPAALRDPGTRLVLVSRAPYSMLEQYRQFLGGELPCYSAPDGVFGDTDPGEPWEQVPVLSLFHRQGTTVVHVGTAPALGLTARPAAQTARS